MVKSMKKSKIMQLIIAVVLLVSFSGCSLLFSLGGSESLKVAERLQKKVSALSSFKSGNLLLSSSYTYYQDNVEYVDEVLAQIDEYDFTEEEKEAVIAWQAISTAIVSTIPASTDDETSQIDGVINAAYVGSESSQSVYGVFVYYFNAGVPVTNDVAEKANILGNELGEYFYIKGNYLITADAKFLTGNGITAENIFSAAEAAIK